MFKYLDSFCWIIVNDRTFLLYSVGGLECSGAFVILSDFLLKAVELGRHFGFLRVTALVFIDMCS